MDLREILKMKLARLLATLARMVLRSRHPMIVGITGSVGKSSAKEAIALVLAKDHHVFASPGNYNNEFGLPSAILGIKSPGGSLFGWIGAVVTALLILLRLRPYPEILVLEMGVDRPGDMEYLVSVAKPDVAVLTRIAESHLAAFGTLGAIAKEKGRLIAAVSENGYALLNADDERVMKQAERTEGKVISYGLSNDASVRADHIRLIQEGERVEGISLKLNYDGKSVPFRLPQIIARHHISAVLAAAAAGIAFKMNLVEIAEALVTFKPLPGRMRLLPGKNEMRIIDDTYNASFASTEAALATLREIIAPRKVVILGDMLEIGEGSAEAHRALRDAVMLSGATVFVGVGQRMQFLADALRGTNFPEKSVYHFLDPVIASRAIQDIVRAHDLVLVKGSQGLRMEKVVETLFISETERGDSLCRQSEAWQAKPFVPPAEWM